ncbi:MAG: thiopurine S-methyltransferase [Chloroflexi bacterium]|jgi:SAM-dependent methyltransferase|nr:thiopurine S-methyltransferase [Chloroflexota bacterium]
MSQEEKLEARFWEERYQAGQTTWDIGEPTPPLVDFLNSPDAPTTGKVLVPGCGRGHEAFYLAQHGFEVVGLDFAPSAIQYCSQLAREKGLESQATFEQHDLFKLPDRFMGSFDYAVEHTCFCAIDPAMRPQYARVIHDILRPGGKLLAVFWAHNRQGGPPYRTSAEEIHRLFSPLFEIEMLQPAKRWHPRRAGDELWGVLTRK